MEGFEYVEGEFKGTDKFSKGYKGSSIIKSKRSEL